MKRLSAVSAIVVFFFCAVYSVEWTNTVLPEKINIRAYRVVSYRTAGPDSKIRLITREIETASGKKYYYFIDTDTLHFGLTDRPGTAQNSAASDKEASALEKIFRLQSERKRPFGSAQENFPEGPDKNIVLTTDLCPTTNGMDVQFYSNLQSLSSNSNTAVPITIFFSGHWVRSHPAQLENIKNSGLDFIAGNHTFRHHILTNAESLAVFTAELTNTETGLLAKGILPSYFFRFPGLIYHPAYMEELSGLSIVAVNANVWMGTKAKNWGVLLVHSNGCASSEVRIFSKFLKKNIDAIRKKKMVFRDLFGYLQESARAAK